VSGLVTQDDGISPLESVIMLCLFESVCVCRLCVLRLHLLLTALLSVNCQYVDGVSQSRVSLSVCHTAALHSTQEW